MNRYIYVNFVVLILFLLQLTRPFFGAQNSGPVFTILILTYKNEQFAEENLRSACHQKSTYPYQVIVVNDCSTDKTGEIVDRYVQKNNLGSFVKVIHNKVRVGAMENFYNTIHTLIPDTNVVVSLDGDDMLAHDEVLLELEKRYNDPDIWMTWGSGKIIPDDERLSRKVPRWVFQEKKIREYAWVTSHLKTFKAALFKKIKKEDLMYEGKFLQATSDMGYMFPMLEMASAKGAGSKNHHVFIKDTLYLYRIDNPLNEFRVLGELQLQMEEFIRSKPPYESIDSL